MKASKSLKTSPKKSTHQKLTVVKCGSGYFEYKTICMTKLWSSSFNVRFHFHANHLLNQFSNECEKQPCDRKA